MPIATTKTVFQTADGEEFTTYKEAVKHEIVQALADSTPYVSVYDRPQLAEYLLSRFEMTLKPQPEQATEDPDHGEQLAA